MPRGYCAGMSMARNTPGPFPSQTIEQENKMKVDLLLWLGAFPCAIPPLPSWRRAHREGKEEEKQTHAVVTQKKKLRDTPRGFARTRGESQWEAETRSGGGGQSCARGWLARRAAWPGLSLWLPPARPPGCTPAPPLTASPRRRRRRPRQSGTWAAGNHWEGALAPCSFSSLTSRRLAPPLGCAGPAVAALGGSRQAGGARAVAAGWEWGCPRRGRAARVRVCTGARTHGEPLGRTAGAPGWTRALWVPSRMRWRLRRANASRPASGRKPGALSTCRYVPAVATECSGRLLAHARCLGSRWEHFQ